MPHRILLALVLAGALSSPAAAQSPQRVADCSGITLGAAEAGRLFVDQSGKLCLSMPTAPAGKIVKTSTAITANISTTIAAANANRVALAIQCGSGGVAVDETGAALAGAAVGDGTLFIPTGTGAYFAPPLATLTAITARTATAQTCVVTEYLR